MSERPAPLLPNVILAVAFVAFLVVGIITVLVPALSGDSEVEEGETPTSESAPPSGDASE